MQVDLQIQVFLRALQCLRLALSSIWTAGFWSPSASPATACKCYLTTQKTCTRLAGCIYFHPKMSTRRCSAGVIGLPVKDGVDPQLRINHFGPFLLTKLLLPELAQSARIVNVSSRAHKQGSLKIERNKLVGTPSHWYLSHKIWYSTRLLLPKCAQISIYTCTVPVPSRLPGNAGVCASDLLQATLILSEAAGMCVLLGCPELQRLQAMQHHLLQLQASQPCLQWRLRTNSYPCAGPLLDLLRRLPLCRFMQYARSKLCNVLHVLELHRRLAADERCITSYAVSPGRVRTQIFSNLPLLARTLLAPIVWAFFQTPQQVALPADMHLCVTSQRALRSSACPCKACAHMGVHGMPLHPTFCNPWVSSGHRCV